MRKREIFKKGLAVVLTAAMALSVPIAVGRDVKAATTTTSYDFEDGNSVFTCPSRMSVAIENDETLSSNVVSFYAAANTANGYAFGYYDFSSLVSGAVQTTIEFDFYNISGNRSMLTLGGAENRGTTGNSTKGTYSKTGAAFNIGSAKSNSILNEDWTNGGDSANGYALDKLTDKWIHVKLSVDEDSNTYSYNITNVSDDSIIYEGEEIGFLDSEVDAITQIDVFNGIVNTQKTTNEPVKIVMLDNLTIKNGPDGEAVAITVPEPEYYYDFEGDSPLANKGTKTTVADATIEGAGSVATDDGNKYFDNASSSTLASRTNYLSLPTDILTDVYNSNGFTFSAKIKTSDVDHFAWCSPVLSLTNSGNTWPCFMLELRGTAAWNIQGYYDGDSYDNTKYIWDMYSNTKWNTITYTVTKDEVKVYFNGVLVHTDTCTGTENDKILYLANLFAGSETATTAGYFKSGTSIVALGGLQPVWEDKDAQIFYDDVALYTDVLDAKQVKYITTGKIDDISCYRGENLSSPEVPYGKVFAGWYTDTTYETSIAQDKTAGSAYAKFVDENLLKVKYQLKAGTTADSDTTNVRFITAVDSLKYQKVGFDVTFNGNTYDTLNSSTVYTDINIIEDDKTFSLLPTDVFGSTAQFILPYAMKGITKAKFEDTITAKPYWVTLDGTKVYGETRNFAISDSFSDENDTK